MTLNEIKELIELVSKKGFAEFLVERSGFKLKIVASHQGAPYARAEGESGPVSAAEEVVEDAPRASASANAQSAPVPARVEAAERTASDESMHVVKSSIVGTFYRAPNPASDPFVKLGDRVDVGTVLCIVEAMKMMNEIEADAAGEIIKIFVENGQPVEYGQPLFGIMA